LYGVGLGRAGKRNSTCKRKVEAVVARLGKKLNTDAGFFLNSGAASISIVARDSDGKGPAHSMEDAAKLWITKGGGSGGKIYQPDSNQSTGGNR
jgi:hypothetical protein